MENILGLFVLAVFVEGFVEYFVAKADAKQPWLKYVAAFIGVAVALAYKADLLAMLGLNGISPYVGQVITGLILGRGSNYLNDFVSRVRNPKPVVLVENQTS